MLESKGYSQDSKKRLSKNVWKWDGMRKALTNKRKYDNANTLMLCGQVWKLWPDLYYPEEAPEVGELDELETFIGSISAKFGYR